MERWLRQCASWQKGGFPTSLESLLFADDETWWISGYITGRCVWSGAWATWSWKQPWMHPNTEITSWFKTFSLCESFCNLMAQCSVEDRDMFQCQKVGHAQMMVFIQISSLYIQILADFKSLRQCHEVRMNLLSWLTYPYLICLEFTSYFPDDFF